MKIKEVFPKLLIDGSFFTTIITSGRFGSITAPQAGLLYVSDSGRKEAASLVDVVVGEDEVATTIDELQIGLMLNAMYGDKWDRLYETLQAEYNPIENYDKISDITSTDSGTDTSNVGKRKVTNTFGAGQQTNQYGAQQQTNQYGATQETLTNRVYGYDGGYAPKDENVNAALLHTDQIDNIQHTDTISTLQKTDTAEEDARIDSFIHGKKNVITEHTHGNVGVTTNAQMIAGEWEIRQKNFLKMVFADIDELLALKCYA